MAQVNLLGWRETAKRHAKQQFSRQLGIALIIAAVIAALSYHTVRELNQQQHQRTSWLQHEISLLDTDIAELAKLRQQKDHLSNRIKLIQQLHHQRNTTITIFNQLAASTPDGIVLISADKKAHALTLQGYSVSNHQVAEFLRRLKASAIFEHATIRQVVSDSDASADGEPLTNFTVVVTIAGADSEAPL